MNYDIDKIIFRPSDVDLQYSPLRNGIDEPTHVLGAFNPGLERLENGNLIMMVRVAEALENQIEDEHLKIIILLDNKKEIETHPPSQFVT